MAPADIPTVMWATAVIAARLLPFALLIPCIGGRLAPMGARLMLAITAAAGLAFAAAQATAAPDADGLFEVTTWHRLADSARAPLVHRVVMIAREALVGVLLAFTVSLVFEAGAAALELSGRLATSPAIWQVPGQTAPAIRMFSLVFTSAVFFGIDGHVLLVRALTSSYQLVPLATAPDSLFTVSGHGAAWLVHTTAGVVYIAVSMATPVLMASALGNVLVGLFQRIHPGLIGRRAFGPLVALSALAMLAIALYSMAEFLALEFRRLPQMLDHWP